ncbi:hypothetical protein [Streptomyces sp. NBC_00083]|uniref:hypothetical protein n=1 Tax=Streptomyces sp. NBC_00083 TaxID=2975647 RepID=UPI002256FB7D|nr:hypothetical protein [Streptomyces sp. NBC_00083]MCX5387241.1 hypothetical protein [Streptomyces sp. NBC_00083]
MSDRRPEGPGDAGAPVPEPIPRDLPDQQAGAEGDPLDAADHGGKDRSQEHPDPEIPDTDEAGTGRRGAPHSGSKRPGHPVPDEPTG